QIHALPLHDALPIFIRLWLSLANRERIEFRAGQYVNVVLEDGQRRAFSFANAPHDNERIELHIRRIPGGRFTTYVFTDLKVGDELELDRKSTRLNSSH